MSVVFVTSQDIFGNCNSGGAQCSRRNLELLENYFGSENVWVCAFLADPSEKPPPRTKFFPRIKNKFEALVAALQNCKIYPLSAEKHLLAYIHSLHPSLVFIDTSLLGRMIKKIKPYSKTVLFLHNIERLYAKNKVQHEGLQYLPSYWASKSNEKQGISKADRVICLNPRDASVLFSTYGRKADLMLPITFDDSFDEKAAMQYHVPNSKEMLFVGSLFPPNYNGVHWFIDHVMPLLPEYSLKIVGKNFEKRKDKLERNNVFVVGTVDTLEEYYYSHSAVVMPILYGDGMKVKTAEAMMYGRTIFATDEALEGYNVEGVEGIFRCNTAPQFAENIRNFYNETQTSTLVYQKPVRELFLKQYETSAQNNRFATFIKDLLE